MGNSYNTLERHTTKHLKQVQLKLANMTLMGLKERPILTHRVSAATDKWYVETASLRIRPFDLTKVRGCVSTVSISLNAINFKLQI